MVQPFHLAIPVDNLDQAAHFYSEVLQCKRGRSDDHWIDFNFFGHQLVLHLTDKMPMPAVNPVDGKSVPIPHYGVVLEWNRWHQLVDQLHEKNVKFEIEPYIRFKGKVGEQATLFFYDPCGNALEFKAFKNPDQLFAF
jgi:extradiol dioxygenase family protein